MAARSFLEALHEKYSCEEPLEFEICVPKSAPGIKESGQLVLPQQLSLNQLSISDAGDGEEIKSTCGHVSELDLADNCLSEWEQVFKILVQMPRVCFLNVSANPLHKSLPVDLEASHSFPRVTKLVLNSTQIPWESVWKVLKIFSGAEQLHLSLNDYTHVALPDGDVKFEAVKELFINSNKIEEWTEVAKLGHTFPNMVSLVAVDSQLLTELASDAESSSATFPKLQSLNLSGSRIASWEEVQKLRHFSSLSNVRIQGLPFLQDYEEKCQRQLLIGRLPNISRLNGSHIGDVERQDAERAFIRHYMDRTDKPNRYDELVGTYGHLDPLADIDLKPQEFVTVAVYYEGHSSLRKFNLKLTAAELKRKLAKMVGQPPSKINVHYCDVGCGFGQVQMVYRDRTLLRYRVKDGDEFHVSLKYHELVGIHGNLCALAEVNLKPKDTISVAVHFQGRSSLHKFNVMRTFAS